MSATSFYTLLRSLIAYARTHSIYVLSENNVCIAMVLPPAASGLHLFVTLLCIPSDFPLPQRLAAQPAVTLLAQRKLRPRDKDDAVESRPRIVTLDATPPSLDVIPP